MGKPAAVSFIRRIPVRAGAEGKGIDSLLNISIGLQQSETDLSYLSYSVLSPGLDLVYPTIPTLIMSTTLAVRVGASWNE